MTAELIEGVATGYHSNHGNQEIHHCDHTGVDHGELGSVRVLRYFYVLSEDSYFYRNKSF